MSTGNKRRHKSRVTSKQSTAHRRPAVQFTASRGISRGFLLVGVSAAALLVGGHGAYAGKPLAASLGTAPPNAAINAAQQGAQQSADAALRAKDALARSTRAIQSLQAVQAAARAAAMAASANIPNGLTSGGLVTAVTQPARAAFDPTGKATWEGATMPSQSTSANGHVDVKIKQTQTNAVLSWDSFNIGRDTTLTFDQQGHTNWLALNRVVGNSTAPSQILGSIKADGTVLVINQNGIIFTGSSQINVGSLVASTLDVGVQGIGLNSVVFTLAQRNVDFLQNGLIREGQAVSATLSTILPALAADRLPVGGEVEVKSGASISTNKADGVILLAAPHVINDGHLSAPAGQVVLAAGTSVTVTASTGTSESANPNVRGWLVKASSDVVGAVAGAYVWNQADGLIEANEGNITLVAAPQTTFGTVLPNNAAINDGALVSTTSVSRNGSIIIDARNIQLSTNSVISIAADTRGQTIPQSPDAVSAFKNSSITIGLLRTDVDIQSGSFLYAPGANVNIASSSFANAATLSNVFIDNGAVINVAGLADVEVPASRNEVVISPVKGNELRDSPLYRASFLNGATVYLDPRLSGVRSDGVAWIGSPLIDAASYYQLVGITSAELMTRGGNVSIGHVGGSKPADATGVVVKSGAVIDTSGGWVTYQAGNVRQTQLVTSTGRVVNIGDADPNGSFVGVYGGYLVNHSHWGVADYYTDKLHGGSSYQPAYLEGRDAGTLALQSDAIAFDGTLYAQAYAGPRQISMSQVGTGKSTVAGDTRPVQGASSQLPAGGALLVTTDGGDIVVSHDPPPLPDDFSYGRPIAIAPDGSYTSPNSMAAADLPASRTNVVQISDRQIQNAGLSELSFQSGGSITINADASVNLNPGGVFNALAGRRINIDGSVTAPGGRMTLETNNFSQSIFAPDTPTAGSYDININGVLSVGGRWVNDFNVAPGDFEGSAWLSGGSISMIAAPRVLSFDNPTAGLILPWGWTNNAVTAATATATDISGNILINHGSTLDLSGGGRIDQNGKFNLTATGGNLSLKSDDGFFQVLMDPTGGQDLSRFRVPSTILGRAIVYLINPDAVTARIVIDPDSIKAHGFGGGGTFSLTTPQFSLGDGAATAGTILPFDFFSKSGFGTYNITSYKTDISASTFTNGLGGYNAVLATQTLTIGAGQSLLLAQSVLPSLLNNSQSSALLNLASGSGRDLLSVLSPIIPDNAWDSRAVNLNLGGLIELHVAQGGSITGTAGSTLSAAKIFNEGTIQIHGGKITQQSILPMMYQHGIPYLGLSVPDAIAVHQLSDIFSTAPDGSIDPNALAVGQTSTNGEIAGDAFDLKERAIYLLGILDANQGIVLAPGSVTDLSGTVVSNPRAVGSNSQPISAGRVVAGGTISSPAAVASFGKMFGDTRSVGVSQLNGTTSLVPETIAARPSSTIDLSGASGSFDQLTPTQGPGLNQYAYKPSPAWSDAGSLIAANGGTFTGAVIDAKGGTPQANGGTLVVLDPIIAQHDPAMPTAGVISADMISNAGFGTLVAIGSVSSVGDATLSLDRGFFLTNRPYGSVTATPDIRVGFGNGDPLIPVVRTAGRLEIDAPYIRFDSAVDAIQTPGIGTAGTGSVIFKANEIDISGATIFDKSVAKAELSASGDIRLNGVQQTLITFVPDAITTTFSLNGELAVNGDLTLNAAQIYPTTGSTFTISSTAVDGTISFGRTGSNTPATPYSAGGNLGVYAAHIVQGGVVRVPFGHLNLGSNAPYLGSPNTVFAPATQSVVLLDGSVTGVSADGLIIPYGITTDQKEWYFAPTSAAAITRPPEKVLSISSANIALNSGATIDLTGGGEVYAYEFVPGTGGSHDVLDRLNADQYSGNKGLQYPDGRQIYAIVPGLSNAPVAAYDPIYSASYGNLYSSSGVGQRVYLNAAPGLAAGWYTLLPAKYAMLPGGMRVVEQTGVSNVIAGSGYQNLDGSLLVSGYYGDALSGSYQSQLRQFSVESQSVFRQYSKIVLTMGSAIAIAQAQTAGILTPRLGIDAGQLILNPLGSLTINTTLSAEAAPGGRGSQVDIGGANFEIVSDLSAPPTNPAANAIRLTAGSLTNLNAGSLLIGGTRTDNADGTTALHVTAQTIVVANDASHPLSAPEIVLAVDDQVNNPAASSITLADGATIIATGTLTDQRAGNYVIDARPSSFTTPSGEIHFVASDVTAIGALFRVANGPERLVTRLRASQSVTGPDAGLTVGNITAKGSSIGLDTSNDVSVAGNATLQGNSISLGAPAIAFTSGSVAAGTIQITPQLQGLLSQGSHLTLHAQTTIGFDDGTYKFGSTTLDAEELVSFQGGTVNINADQLNLANSGAGAGIASDGTGVLSITAGQIAFGPGTIATKGFGAGVSLTGANGVFAGGQQGGLDVGGANLTVTTPYLGDRNITGSATESAHDVTLKTSGSVLVTSAGMAAIDQSKLAGVPGSSVTIQGSDVAVSGTVIHVTAGILAINATGGLVLAAGAILEAPGYSKTFGDSADPVVRSSPGGRLSLSAAGAAGINLGNARLNVGGGTGNGGDLSFSALNSSVNFGTAVIDGHGAAGNSGGTFSFDTKAAIDLVALNNVASANGFTGGFNVRTRTGDIALGAGETLKSGSVTLTADGGFVTIGGTIDTSGINGGNISLYGTSGVTLHDSARLNAYATGYTADDTRPAKGGNVTLGTDYISGTTSLNSNGDGSITGTSGTITVASGAVIDVSAKRPGDRLVRLLVNGVVVYQYVQGDEGGTVTFRAPATGNSGHQTVDVHVASANSIVGASAINVEGFKRWDLTAVANSGLYAGVSTSLQDNTLPSNTVVLNTATDLDTANADGTLTSVGKVNFLSDVGPGSIADYVQNFDISAADNQLGGLGTQSNFHRLPGVDLVSSGDIVLSSNWNLGAGVVNLTGALVAGDVTVNQVLQTTDPTTGYLVTSGRESDLLDRFTKMTYRTGGKAYPGSAGQPDKGEAPVLSLRAGGNLDLKGSITDGFFLFRDQSDETYLSYRARSMGALVTLNGGFNTGNGTTALTDWSTWNGSADPSVYLGLSLSTAGSAILPTAFGQAGSVQGATGAPYSAIGNSPAALGSFVADSTGNVNGGGDPIGSAVVFPLLPSTGAAAASSTYNLVAGAANLASGSTLAASSNPLGIDPFSMATLTVEGMSTYKAPALSQSAFLFPGLSVDGAVGYGSSTKPTQNAGTAITFAQWLTAITATRFTGEKNTSVAVLNLGTSGSGTDPNRALVMSLFSQFASEHGLQQNSSDPSRGYRYSPSAAADGSNTQYIAMSVANFKLFLTEKLDPALSQVAGNLAPVLPVPKATGVAKPTGDVFTSIRTGTGSINLAAAGDADLRGSLNPLYLVTGGTNAGTLGPIPSAAAQTSNQQIGGPAIYTVGKIASIIEETLVDPVTGVSVNIDPSSFLPKTSVFGGAGIATALPSVFVADTLYLDGGGDVSVTAGRDVLGRAHLAQTHADVPNSRWMGSMDQQWRLGTIPNFRTSNITINPQLFREGLGALGGGNITVNAGRDVSDISTVSDDSLISANATPAQGLATGAVMEFGTGNVVVNAGRDILAVRVDAASGTASLDAARDIKGATPIVIGTHLQIVIGAPGSGIVPTTTPNEVQIRISDATASVEAGGSITLQGIAALGVAPSGPSSGAPPLDEIRASYGFYSSRSGLSLIANGSVTITNNDLGSLQQDYGLTIQGDGVDSSSQFAAIYPASLTAASITGDLNIITRDPKGAAMVEMIPSSTGQLQLFAAGNIAPTTIAMLDADPFFVAGMWGTGIFTFPTVLSTTPDTLRKARHNQNTTHAGDTEPVYIYAGNDIGTAAGGLILSVPKQARISAGRDIINMMLFGQNISGDDITRVVAGRDIIATTQLLLSPPAPAMMGNTFVLGGPGQFFLEAGRNLGPFLNSAVANSEIQGGGPLPGNGPRQTYGGGVMTVGNQWNPWLDPVSAELNVSFGVGKGANYIGLRDAYVAPGTAANALGGYSDKLAVWMKQNDPKFDQTGKTAAQIYDEFLQLPELKQRVFLIDEVYFNELRATADQTSPSYKKYSRGYTAVNTLFPASLGYTLNGQEGGAKSDGIVRTGDLDLRLATIETMFGGNINILGPGGNVLAGSVVATSEQAARRTYDGGRLFAGNFFGFSAAERTLAIPPGYEGVITLRGGDINTFTDGDFLLNQSRLFTEQGGNIMMWSSNGDLNAGQGPKTSVNFPPIVVHVDQNGVVSIDELGGVTGAGIASLQTTLGSPPADVFLVAPRGTVDFGDAGARVSGNLSVAAQFVLNADNVKVQGTAIGLPTIARPDTGALNTANNTNTTKKADVAPTNSDQPSIIIVEFLGFGGGDGSSATPPPPPTANGGGTGKCDPADATCR
jgi:filamentous hemagglutinin family protein